MASRKTELTAAALVLAALIGIPLWVVLTESYFSTVPGRDLHVINLTAVAVPGVWTEEEVVGHSYWRREPKPARLVVRAGETIVVRLKSADVTHGFAIPDLGVGPVAVEPGHVTEVRFMPEDPGEYIFQCSIRCGHCHEEMRGTIVIVGPGESPADYPGGLLPRRSRCPLHSRDLGAQS